MRIAARHSLGMVVGTIDRGRRVIASAGVMDTSDGREPDGDTIFGIASLTKPFIALLLTDAVQRGEVSYESAAASYLPLDVRLPERNGRRITLLDLATHTAGLPHELPNAQQVAASARSTQEARAALYAYLASYELRTDPGQAWSYSNLDYALISHILEHRTGMGYATLLRERITAPLRMSNTVPLATEVLGARRASPHLASLEPAPEWNKPWMAPVLQSTANDLLTFIAANLPGARTALTPAISKMLAVRRPAPAIGAEQAIGWYVYPLSGRPMVGHSGGGGGFASSVMFDPTVRAGVVLLSNAEILQEDLARHILRPSLPLDQTKTAIALDAAILDKYLGDYRDESGGIARIQRNVAGLVLTMPAGYRAPLTPESATSFFVRGFAGLTVIFAIDEFEKVQSLTWTLNGNPIIARKIEVQHQ